MNHARWLRLSLTAAAVAGIAWYGLRAPPMRVDGAQVEIGEVVDALDAEGRTRLSDRYLITAPIPAQARRVALEVGDPIAVGDVLVVLDPLPSQALDPRSRAEAEAIAAAAASRLLAAGEDLAAALAEARLLDAEAKRLDSLGRQELVARDTIERARMLAQRAERAAASARFREATAAHELAAARSVLVLGSRAGSVESALELTAPVAGVVLRRHFESGRPVQPGEPLLEIGDPTAMEVEVDVLSADAVRLREGMAVELHRWGQTEPLQGRVRRIEPAGFTKISALGVEEQRVWVVVDLTSERERWQRLGDAYRVNARFLVERREQVLRVPASALFRDGEGWAVFRVVDGRAELTPVQVGLDGGAWTEVLAGLAAGEPVIVHPDRDLEHGRRVRLR